MNASALTVGSGLLAALPTGLPAAAASFLLTDRNVEPLLGDGWGETPRLVLPPGEASKSWAQLEELLLALDAAGLDRDGQLVAVGGGVVTDLGGLAASLYRRGIDWVAVPTSLVGQVDAALGGKTAANLGGGKNTVGTFHHPTRVLVDPTALRTLEGRHLRAGLAEILKTALIAGGPLWQDVLALQLGSDGLRRSDEPALAHCVTGCLETKTRLVEQDPFDHGPRRQLNLGHTFGHAFEALSMRDPASALLHGEAVGLGLLCAARLGTLLRGDVGPDDGQSADDLEQLVRERLGAWQLPRTTDCSTDDVLREMGRDKKRLAGTHTVVIPGAPGQVTVQEGVSEEALREALAAVRES
jgi:3-dehydroquinate synthetase